MISLTLPLRIESNANGSQGVTRGGRIARSKKRQALKGIITLALTGPLAKAMRELGVAPFDAVPALSVRMTRIAPRELDDDNLAFSLKGVRDSIAKCLGVNDRNPLITWEPRQEKGAPKAYALRIEIGIRAMATSEGVGT